VGVLEPTGTANDRAIFINLESFYHIAAHRKEEADRGKISAILVQHTNWSNVERALERLRAEGALSLAAIAEIPEPALAELIRPAGTPLVKARRLRALAQLAAQHGGLGRLLSLPTEELRARLLATAGICSGSGDIATGNPVGSVTAPVAMGEM